MRILCLHGLGTSGEIFQGQMMRTIYKLKEQGHEFVFIDGQFDADPTSDIKAIYEPPYLGFYPFAYAHQIRNAQSYVLEQMRILGPFDGVMGFSQGAALAASLIIEHKKQNPYEEDLFKFAIFIGATLPFNVDDLTGMQSFRNAKAGTGVIYPGEFAGEINVPVPLSWPKKDATDADYDGSADLPDGTKPVVAARYHPQKTPNATINVPTVHVIGKQDQYAEQSRKLVEMCSEDGRCVLEHNEGHRMPRDARSNDKIMKGMENVIDMAGMGGFGGW